MPTFQGLFATTRAMCWPNWKQRRAVGWGAMNAFTKMGTSGGMGRVPSMVLTGLRKA